MVRVSHPVNPKLEFLVYHSCKA